MRLAVADGARARGAGDDAGAVSECADDDVLSGAGGAAVGGRRRRARAGRCSLFPPLAATVVLSHLGGRLFKPSSKEALLFPRFTCWEVR